MMIYEYLQLIQSSLLSSLAQPNLNAENSRTEQARYLKHQMSIKSSLRTIAFRLGSDLMDKTTESLSSEETTWVENRLLEIMEGLRPASSIPETAKDVYFFHLSRLYEACGGAMGPQDILVHAVAASSRLENAASLGNSIAWTVGANNASSRTHGGLFAYASIWIYTKASLAKSWAFIAAALGAVLTWISVYSKETMAQLGYSASLGLFLQVVGISLYVILMLPRIAQNIYKDLRNIFLVNYRDKRWHSSWRLGYSLLMGGLGFTLGLFVPGGSFMMAAGVATLGWVVGHSLYKAYKRWNDKRVHFCSNPQKWHLKREALEAALNHASSQNSVEASANASHNLPVLLGQLELRVSYAKQQQTKEWSRIEKIAYGLWGLKRPTSDGRQVQGLIHALKRKDWEGVKSRGASLGLAINPANRRDFGLEAEVATSAVTSSPPSQLPVPESVAAPVSRRVSVGSGVFGYQSQAVVPVAAPAPLADSDSDDPVALVVADGSPACKGPLGCRS